MWTANIKNMTFWNTNQGVIHSRKNLVVDNCLFEDIQGGNGTSCISSTEGTLTVRNSTFRNNRGVDGAIAVANGSSLEPDKPNSITNSIFVGNNHARVGGAINVGIYANLTVDGCVFDSNTARAYNGLSYGGAIHSYGSISVSNSVFVNNTAENGGAIFSSGYAERGNLKTSTSLFANNKANYGGGIMVSISNGQTSATQITNSTFSGNTAEFSGGGIYINSNPNVSNIFTNLTITGNRTREVATNTGSGGGISIDGSSTTLQLHNSIVAGNTDKLGSNGASDIDSAVATTSSFNVIGHAGSAGGLLNNAQGNLVGLNGTGTRPLDTIISVTLGDNGGSSKTHALVRNSVALSSGSTGVPGYVPYDQRGTPRGINADLPDRGAYEVQHPLTPVGVPTTYARTFQPKPSTSINEAYLKGLYQSTLLRAADSVGLAGWLQILNAGTQTHQQVAYGFVNSVENRRNQVTFFYRYFLSREPETAGLNFHIARLYNGVDEAQLMSEFILSQEFTGQNNNTEFLITLYYAVLGRQADSAGLNGWLTVLNSGVSRATVTASFVRSTEGIARAVNGFFASYLKRQASAAELDAYNGIVANQTFGITASQILASGEFRTAAQQNMN